MRLNIILSLYKFKIKSFFGAFRASKANLALLLVYIFSLLPSAFSFSIMIVDAVRQNGVNIETYIEVLSAGLSFLTAFILFLTFRGYTAFEHEQNFVFTSPIKPIEFLIASILADLTTILVFIYPLFAIYTLIVLWLNLPFSSAILILSAMLIFVFLLFLLKSSLSIMMSLQRNLSAKITISAMIFLLLFPSISSALNLPLKYSILPYPSTLLAKILVGEIFGLGFQPLDFLGLSICFLLLASLFTAFSRENFFPLTRRVPFVSPFDASIRMQALKMERSIKIFSRVPMLPTLNLESRSLLAFLMKKELIRMIREGSLFTVIFMYLIISFIAAVISAYSPQDPQSANFQPAVFIMFFLGTYSLIVPLILISNWRISDFENLWVPITSGANMRAIIRALLYDFIMVSSAIPAAIILILAAIYGINPLMALVLVASTSIVGCSVNLYVMIKSLASKRRGVSSALAGWASMLLSALLLTPTYSLIFLSQYLKLSENVHVLFAAVILLHSALVMRVFSGKTEKNIIYLEF
ncbi:MAG: hypothetical protein N3E47_00960 [Candidatus Bathyarchaeota archaeon]|nr:hypothetical protein [Candidatus Bathyarchaeota archaeon]